MSYEIVKSIKIKEGKVYIKAAASNVYPRDYTQDESKYFTKILQERGRENVDIEILKTYESGNFQKGNNKYVRALKILRYMPEYKSFNWRLGGIGKEYKEINERRKTLAFNDLLRQALKSKLPKDKFILSKLYRNDIIYLRKLTSRSAFWTKEKTKAKIFNYIEEIEKIKALFDNSENWQTERR